MSDYWEFTDQELAQSIANKIGNNLGISWGVKEVNGMFRVSKPLGELWDRGILGLDLDVFEKDVDS